MKPRDSFTYHHKTLDQKKWIDHFLVSPSLLHNDLSNFEILDDGDNLSDHFPIMMNLKVDCTPHIQNRGITERVERLRWNDLSPAVVDGYTARLGHLISLLPESVADKCHHSCVCSNASCHQSIQEEYDCLLHCLQQADSLLPRKKSGVGKDWWTEGLTELKKKSIEIHNVWKGAGQPRQGPIHSERLRVRAAYKSALKAAQRAPKQASWDSLHSALSEKDTTSFWKTWRHLYNKNKSDLPPVVDGISSSSGIANLFKNNFMKNSTPNNAEKVEKLDERFNEEYSQYLERHKYSCDCSNTKITTIHIIDALLCMKGGKSADADNISVEHLHNAPLNFLTRLASLLDAMLSHSFVPRQFQLGFMLPLVKDQSGNHSDSSNYRGITISPIISKVLEHVLKAIYFDYLTTSEYQFGFKQNSSTVHALHCLRETVSYYVNNDSRVFCTFLDASKAFDRLVHSGLFLKLMNRNIPLKFLKIIITWYGHLQCRVKWGNEYSEWFLITAGVRQGGILSPSFYCIYVDELLSRLKNSGKGCHYLSKFAGALFYADDMAILAPSIRGLCALLRICEDYCLEWDICLNAKKSKNLYFGQRVNIHVNVELNGKVVDWVDEWVYLGVSLKSAKTFDCSIKEKIKKFFRCTNAIFRIEDRSNDTVMLRLLESHCVPLLTYAIEVIQVKNRDESRQLRVAYNSLFRKLFGYRWSESVTSLQSFLGRPTWEQLVEKRRSNFVNRIRSMDPSTLLSTPTLSL